VTNQRFYEQLECLREILQQLISFSKKNLHGDLEQLMLGDALGLVSAVHQRVQTHLLQLVLTGRQTQFAKYATFQPMPTVTVAGKAPTKHG
jgi:hypothetical protein